MRQLKLLDFYLLHERLAPHGVRILRVQLVALCTDDPNQVVVRTFTGRELTIKASQLKPDKPTV